MHFRVFQLTKTENIPLPTTTKNTQNRTNKTKKIMEIFNIDETHIHSYLINVENGNAKTRNRTLFTEVLGPFES